MSSVDKTIKENAQDSLMWMVSEQMRFELKPMFYTTPKMHPFNPTFDIGFTHYLPLLQTGFETVHLILGISKPWSLNQEWDLSFLIEAVTTPNAFGHDVVYWRIKALFEAERWLEQKCR